VPGRVSGLCPEPVFAVVEVLLVGEPGVGDEGGDVAVAAEELFSELAERCGALALAGRSGRSADLGSLVEIGPSPSGSSVWRKARILVITPSAVGAYGWRPRRSLGYRCRLSRTRCGREGR